MTTSATDEDLLPAALGTAAREFLTGPHRLLIGSERPEAADGRTFATLDPSSGREIARVAHAGEPDVQLAVEAAREAFANGLWATLPAAERERLMIALAEAVEEHAEELAQIESLDNGKPVKLAQYVDVRGTAAHLRYFAGWPTKI
jgi:acyl-CoA reductase-like NAD-dependent aldehyde dehydrogenase